MTGMDVHLKEGAPHDPGFQAWILSLPGFATWAEKEQEVLRKVADRVQGYRSWLAEHGEDPPPVLGPVRVVERVLGDEVLFAWDRVPATPDEIRRTRRLLAWSRADLLDTLARLPPQALDWSPAYRRFPAWADWRTVRQIVEHVALTEVGYYLAWIGHERGAAGPLPVDPRDLLVATREETDHFLEGLAEAADRLRLAEKGGEAWTVRKALRRLVWHERLHLASIRRIARDHAQSVRGSGGDA
jgi:hypothetical protein